LQGLEKLVELGAALLVRQTARIAAIAMSKGSAKSWDHASVYEALVASGKRTKDSPKNRYVVLYDQGVNCAILYEPGGSFNARPLHLNPGRNSWRTDAYKKILPALGDIVIGNRLVDSFLYCKVTDWTVIAKALGLRLPKTSE
jgi:hypothetical protein